MTRDPVFDEGDIFRLTVPLDDDYSPEKGHLQKRETTQQTTQKTDLSATQKISEGKLSVTAKQIMAMTKVEPKVTTVELARRLGMTRDGINYQIRFLKKANVLRRIGPDKGGYWKVL